MHHDYCEVDILTLKHDLSYSAFVYRVNKMKNGWRTWMSMRQKCCSIKYCIDETGTPISFQAIIN